MLYVKLLLLAAVVFIILFFVGGVAAGFVKKEQNSVLLNVVFGFCIALAMFQVLAVPMIFLDASFQLLVYSWIAVIAVLVILSVVLNVKRYPDLFRTEIQGIKRLPWLSIAVIVLVLLQAFVLFRYMHVDDDDAFFVAAATTAIEKNSIFGYSAYTGEPVDLLYNARYVCSPLPILWAAVSSLTNVHPAILMHTFLPVLLIPFAYMVYLLVGKKLFPEKPVSQWLFLFFLCVIHIFGNFSIYTSSTFLLVRIWQGKAILASVILPMLLYFIIRTMKDYDSKADWIMLFLAMTAASLVSSMGIILAPILVGSYGIVYAAVKRKLSVLFAAGACCIPCIACGLLYLLAF